jgi:hypothetical protein
MHKNNWLLSGLVVLTASLVFFALFYVGGKIGEMIFYVRVTDEYQDSVVLFYGDGCIRCVTVDRFIQDNQIEEKVSFVSLEVFDNQINANILSDRAQFCGVPSNQIGVPFIWDGVKKQCVIGYVDIINFFREKLKQVE